MRIETIGDATLYLGDCLEILPTLDKSLGRYISFDHVITDPPYETEAHTPMRRTRESNRTGKNVSLDFDSITGLIRKEVCNRLFRMTGGWMLSFCQVEATGKWQEAFNNSGAKYKRSMVWVKPDASPQFNGQSPAQGYECIAAAWLGDGVSLWNGGGKRGVYTFNCTHGRHGSHPTEKPTALMNALINDFTNSGQIILDPFMGSGTTGVACANLGRKFIGIEIDYKYFDIACERIEAAHAQGRLFA